MQYFKLNTSQEVVKRSIENQTTTLLPSIDVGANEGTVLSNSTWTDLSITSKTISKSCFC